MSGGVTNLFVPKFGSMRRALKPKRIKSDLVAAGVLGLESVPDGLATGVLAGVNPVAGVYGSVYGFLGGSLFARTSLMAVQTTGAMAIMVADQELDTFDDPARALTTLTLMSGIFMALATMAGAARLLRFIPNAVMVGFINAVGVNIILGQVADLTGYSSDQAYRLFRVIDTIVHPSQIQLAVLAVGLASVALILWLRETRLGALGLLVAVGLASWLAIAIGGPVDFLRDVATIPSGVPAPRFPDLAATPALAIGALSIAFVGLIQGAGVSAGLPEPDASPPNAKQDFASQAAGNVLASTLGGMPVGGSMSGSALSIGAGAKSRMVYVYASVLMVVVMVAFARVVSAVAMPAIAGLLLIIGVDSLKPHRASLVVKSGRMNTMAMAATFLLCLFFPVQYAVVVGVGISMVLVVVEQANQLTFRRLVIASDGRVREEDPPERLGEGEVVVLQPYGNLFFGSAPVMADALPDVDDESRHSVVILRLRGVGPLGFAVGDVLKRYARRLREVDSKLVVVTDDDETMAEFDRVGVTGRVGVKNVYTGSRWFGDATTQAFNDSQEWVASREEQ